MIEVNVDRGKKDLKRERWLTSCLCHSQYCELGADVRQAFRSCDVRVDGAEVDDAAATEIPLAVATLVLGAFLREHGLRNSAHAEHGALRVDGGDLVEFFYRNIVDTVSHVHRNLARNQFLALKRLARVLNPSARRSRVVLLSYLHRRC